QDAAKRSKATRVFCLECMGNNLNSVTECPSVYCPVYPYRHIKTDRPVLFDMNISDDVVLEMTKTRERVVLNMAAKHPID
ncbi:hypothetical protein KAR91_17285, partial [Candidatus Pacearchaeota archaeon]|nr:hypothetical protein [Candidatus Pacearchaeota archaeon]